MNKQIVDFTKATIKSYKSPVILKKEIVLRYCQETVNDKTALFKIV